VPEPAADEILARLGVHVVAGVGALAAGARPRRRVVRLVRRGVVAEADVAVDAEVDVLEGQLGDGLVDFDDLFGQGRDEGLPVFERAAELSVMGCGGLVKLFGDKG